MTDRMRESLFSSIARRLDDAKVLDLYAGTGSLGLEALSRGAADVVFVESDRAALAALRSNVSSIGLGGTVVADDVGRYLARCRDEYDIVFVDPPYAVESAVLSDTMQQVARVVADQGIAVVHRRLGEDPPATIASLVLVGRKRYGGAELWRYAKE